MDLLTAIKNKNVFLLDGAIGTELDKRGLMGRGGNNIEHPEIVLEIQRLEHFNLMYSCIRTTQTILSHRLV